MICALLYKTIAFFSWVVVGRLHRKGPCLSKLCSPEYLSYFLTTARAELVTCQSAEGWTLAKVMLQCFVRHSQCKLCTQPMLICLGCRDNNSGVDVPFADC